MSSFPSSGRSGEFLLREWCQDNVRFLPGKVRELIRKNVSLQKQLGSLTRENTRLNLSILYMRDRLKFCEEQMIAQRLHAERCLSHSGQNEMWTGQPYDRRTEKIFYQLMDAHSTVKNVKKNDLKLLFTELQKCKQVMHNLKSENENFRKLLNILLRKGDVAAYLDFQQLQVVEFQSDSQMEELILTILARMCTLEKGGENRVPSNAGFVQHSGTVLHQHKEEVNVENVENPQPSDQEQLHAFSPPTRPHTMGGTLASNKKYIHSSGESRPLRPQGYGLTPEGRVMPDAPPMLFPSAPSAGGIPPSSSSVGNTTTYTNNSN